MVKLPKIAAVDFDGTLVKDKFPEIGEINSVVWDSVKQLQDNGYKLILWTCRSNDLQGTQLDDAVAFCKKEGLEFDAVNENLKEVQDMFGGDTRKVYADVYIDDKNLVPYIPIEWRLEIGDKLMYATRNNNN